MPDGPRPFTVLAFDYGLYQVLMSVWLGATLVLERSFTYPAQIINRMRETRMVLDLLRHRVSHCDGGDTGNATTGLGHDFVVRDDFVARRRFGLLNRITGCDVYTARTKSKRRVHKEHKSC